MDTLVCEFLKVENMRGNQESTLSCRNAAMVQKELAVVVKKWLGQENAM